MKYFVVMQNDTPRIIVQAHDVSIAQRKVDKMAYEAYKFNNEQWDHEAKQFYNNGLEGYDYYRQTVYWHLVELQLQTL